MLARVLLCPIWPYLPILPRSILLSLYSPNQLPPPPRPSPRSAVFVMPTVNCLVELTEMPFCVLSLADIEIVNLERVGFNLKNFDMAIVFKDFTRDVRGCDPRGMSQ